MLVLSIVLIITMTAACSSNNSNKNGSSTADNHSAGEQPANKDEVSLQLSIWGNENYKKVVEGELERFTQQLPHVSVEVLLIPYADYQQKMSIMTASKTAPDVIWVADRMLPQFLAGNLLMDIAEVMSDEEYDFADNIQSGFNTLRKGDELYGVPFTNPPKVLFFNKTMFEEKGLKTPLEHYQAGTWTYDEFLSSARALTDASEGEYGASLVTSNGWKLWADNLVDTIWAYGADFMSADGTEYVFNTPEAKQVLQLFSDMIFVDQVHPKPGDQTMFETGKIAMSRQNFGYKNTLASVTDFEWDIAPMPKGPVADAPVADGVAAYAVTNDTKNKEEALALLKFMTSKETVSNMSVLFMPNRTSVLESGIVTKDVKAPTAEGVQAAIIDVLNGNLRSNFNHPNWQQIDVKAQIAMDLLYTQNFSIDQVLEKMESDVAPLLK